MDAIQKFFANFLKHGTISKSKNKVKSNVTNMVNNSEKTVKETEVEIDTDGLVTVLQKQNKDTPASLKNLNNGFIEFPLSYPQEIAQNIDTTENVSADDVETIQDTQESLKEFDFDEMLHKINKSVPKECGVLDTENVLDNMIEEYPKESVKFEIPRFDLQDLTQGFGSYNDEDGGNNEVIDLDKIYGPDEMDIDGVLITLEGNNIYRPTDNPAYSVNIKTNVQEAEIISISSEDSQDHETDLKPQENIVARELKNDEPNNMNNKNDEPIANTVIFIDHSDNVCEVDREIGEPKNVKNNNEERYEPKNVNEGSNANIQNVRELDDSDKECGYHSSDFEFITEDEAKMDGLIINFNPDRKRKRNVSKPKRVKTIEVSIDQFSEQKYVSSSKIHLNPANNIQGNFPELNVFNYRPIEGSGTNPRHVKTTPDSKIPESKKSRMQVYLPNILCHGSNKHKNISSHNNGSNLRKVRIIRSRINDNNSNNVQNPGNSNSSNVLQQNRITNNKKLGPVTSERSTQNIPGPKNSERNHPEFLEINSTGLLNLSQTHDSECIKLDYNFSCGPNGLTENDDTVTISVDTVNMQRNDLISNLSECPGSNNFGSGPSNSHFYSSGLNNVGSVRIHQHGNVPEINNYGPGFRNLQDYPGPSDMLILPQDSAGFNTGPVPIHQRENVPEINNYDPGFRNLQDYPGPSNVRGFPQDSPGLSAGPVPINLQERSPEVNQDPGFRNIQDFPEPSNRSYPDPRIERWRAFQQRNRNQFVLDYSYRDNHRMLHGEDYYNLFEPNLNPLPYQSMRQMENKSIRSMSMMLVEYDGVGFDMRMLQGSESEDDEEKEKASECAQRILDMYPGENTKMPRRTF